jgi:hypothetical protein
MRRAAISATAKMVKAMARRPALNGEVEGEEGRHRAEGDAAQRETEARSSTADKTARTFA